MKRRNCILSQDLTQRGVECACGAEKCLTARLKFAMAAVFWQYRPRWRMRTRHKLYMGVETVIYRYSARVVLTLTLTRLQATVMLLHAVLCAQIKPTFHKINIHAAMTPSDIQKHFKLVFDQARELSDAFKKSKERLHKKASVDETIVSVDNSKRWTLNRRRSMATRAPAGHSGEEIFLYRMPSVTVSHVAHNFCLFPAYTPPATCYISILYSPIISMYLITSSGVSG